jgi:endonuclease YncB( thermonuclease family)
MSTMPMFSMLPCKSFSCLLAVLFLFICSAGNALSIGVNPESKQYLRSTLKDRSASRSKAYSQAGAGGRSRSAAGGSSASASKKAKGESYKSSINSSIVITPPVPKQAQPAKMVGIEDGDTIQAVINGSPCKVSLYGIDAPEKTQPYGPEAARAAARFIGRKNIQLQLYDKLYEGNGTSRCLAVVLVNGKNVNGLLVRGGYAWVNKEHCYESFCSSWETDQRTAQAKNKGLWADTAPVPPWTWRNMTPEERGKQRHYSPVANGMRSRYGRLTTIIGGE